MTQRSTVLQHPARSEATGPERRRQATEDGQSDAEDGRSLDDSQLRAETASRGPRPTARRGVSRRLIIWFGLLIALAGLGVAYQDTVQAWGDQALHFANERLLGSYRIDMANEVVEVRSATEAMVQASEARVMGNLSPEIADARTELTRLSDDMGEIKAQLAALLVRMDGAEAAQGDGLASLTALTDSVDAQSARLATFESRFDGTLTRQDRKFRELTLDPLWLNSVQGASASRAMPFSVVSLDVWGGRNQITAKIENELHFLNVGDRVQGWTIEGADIAQQQVTFLDPAERAFVYRLDDASIEPFSVGGLATGMPKLTVVPTPPDARVMVMNIEPRYRPAMPLPPGAYDILVRKPGYQTFRRWIVLRNGDRELTVDLEPVPNG